MRSYLILIFGILAHLILSVGIPYLIQFKLGFLGANFVTLKDILGLWLGSQIFSAIIIILILSKILK
jgi:hypothetical protein